MRLGSKETLRLVVGAATVSAEARRGGAVRWAGHASYSGLPGLTESIARLVAEPGVRPGSQVVVELEKPLVQCRSLEDLPPVPASRLRPLIEMQSHRFFRKNGKSLVIDAGRTRGKKSSVRAAAAEEPLVLAIIEGVRAAGFGLSDIQPAGPGRPLSLLPMAEREFRRRHSRRATMRLALVVFALWALTLSLLVIHHVRERRAVDRALAELAKPLAVLAEVKREVHTGASMIAAAEADALGQARMIERLAAITAALPDSAFLTSLSLEPGAPGFLGGYAARASEVLARLEAAGAVSAPGLDGLTGREFIAGTEWERFNIQFGGSPPP